LESISSSHACRNGADQGWQGPPLSRWRTLVRAARYSAGVAAEPTRTDQRRGGITLARHRSQAVSGNRRSHVATAAMDRALERAGGTGRRSRPESIGRTGSGAARTIGRGSLVFSRAATTAVALVRRQESFQRRANVVGRSAVTGGRAQS